LLEYQAKELFNDYGIPTKASVVLDKAEHAADRIEEAGLKYPVVLKAQVPIGGRGKAGGIRFANDPGNANAIATDLMFSQIRGMEVRQLLAEEAQEINEECYVSIILDRISKKPMLVFSAVGGMEIEETAKVSPEKIIKCVIEPSLGIHDYTARYVLKRTGIDMTLLPQFADTIRRLYDVFTGFNCLITEINPLVIGQDGSFVALDGKVEIDSSALYLHPRIMEFKQSMKHSEHPLVAEAEAFGFLYIPITENGKTVVMSNGSGMLMNCIDRITDAGISVGAAMDLGGGATAERVREAVRILLKTPQVDSMFISIFGGITRCDEVARGIRDGYADSGLDIDIIVRMEGTNRQIGIEILEAMDSNMDIVSWPEEGVKKLAERKNEHEHIDR
jgi:succinyl-CoA synthetase beta subunit